MQATSQQGDPKNMKDMHTKCFFQAGFSLYSLTEVQLPGLFQGLSRGAIENRCTQQGAAVPFQSYHYGSTRGAIEDPITGFKR